MNIPGSLSTGFNVSKDLGGGILSNERPTFEFGAGPYRTGQFQVSSFKGTEEQSKLYDFEVTVAGRNYDEITLAALILGQSGHLALTLPDGTHRTIHGVIAGYGHLGVYQADSATKLWMPAVPKFWLLTKKKNSRIFQNKRIDEIIKMILDEGAIEHTFKLTRKYPVREYCVQYQETDYDFVTRLAAEEGIFFFFEQPNAALDELMGAADGLAEEAASAVGGIGGALLGVAEGAALQAIDSKLPEEKVIFADSADTYPAMPKSAFEITGDLVGALGATLPSALGSLGININAGPTLIFRDAAGMVPTDEHVFSFEMKRTIRPKLTSLHDWDFKRPTLTKTAQAQSDADPFLKLPSLSDIGADLSGSLSASLSYSPTQGLHVGASGHLKASFELPPRLDPRRFEIYDHEADDHREHDLTKVDAQAA